MPDGPHRSLPMKPAWKRLLREVESPVNPTEDSCRRLECALESDWHDEGLGQRIAELRSIEAVAKGILGPEEAVRLIEDVRTRAAGSPLVLALVDCFVQSISSNGIGGSPLIGAAEAVLTVRFARCLRQMEEHVRRECTQTRASAIIGRLHQLADEFDSSKIARDLCTGRERGHRRTLPKKVGIHDGPSLPSHLR